MLAKTLALSLVRKHRLWETFLVDRLGFDWDEVHDIAEQLEHVDSVELVERLDAFLGHPTRIPTATPFPNTMAPFILSTMPCFWLSLNLHEVAWSPVFEEGMMARCRRSKNEALDWAVR